MIMLCMKNVFNVIKGVTRIRDKFRGKGFTFSEYSTDDYQNYLRYLQTAFELKTMDKEQELDSLKANLDKVEKKMR